MLLGTKHLDPTSKIQSKHLKTINKHKETIQALKGSFGPQTSSIFHQLADRLLPLPAYLVAAN